MGTTVVWHLPQVGRNERVDLQYQISGEGEIDTDLLNTFHGAVFGDEIEDASEPASNEASQEAEADEAVEEAPAVNFRDDVLDRVMEAHGIPTEDRDAFIAHAANFDHDQNGYLKKQELEDAAAAWTADDGSDDADSGADEASADEGDEEEGQDDARDCPICQNPVPAGESACSCGFSFDS